MTDIQFRSDMPVTLIDAMGDDLMIARAAWEDWTREPKNDKHLPALIGTLMKDKHGTPFEFGSLVLHVECPLFVVAQFQRHRIGFSYAQRSARYREMLPHFYVPAEDRPLKNVGTKMRPEFVHDVRPSWITDDVEWAWLKGEEQKEIRYHFDANYAWTSYQELLSKGVAEEIARIVLPVSTYTGFSVQMNPRSIMNFLQLRVQDERNTYDTRPQYEIEQVAKQIEALFAARWPITYQKFNEHGRVAP